MFSISKESALAAASTCLFVLLWSSGAIFSKWGLAHASPFAFLLMRFAIAFMALLLIIPLMKFQMPRGSTAVGYALATGVVLLGAYQIFYLLALDLKVTPGVMATVMGVQPILTAVIMERRHSFSRSLGLLLGLAGLVLVVYQGIGLAGLSWAGMLYALLALASMTAGTLMQKRITHNPLGTLPLQYLAGLLVCAVFVPFQPFHFEHSAGFVVPVLWMGLVVSVLATLLLYRMIARGNLVNVTSLFYLVPAVTAVMDYLIFGNKLAALSVLGMAMIIIGLMFVFRKTR
ncbi:MULTISPECIES: DMT family transporter [Pseudomonas]|jgi:drug/metabolite transporter (DMT)-like permease|uniref:DMT family transporter n=1 Tax=Pseudomonas fragi TaxID=296 RepID=A0A9Q5FNS0_PSEFR|nr:MULTISPECIES: DMT family transporter [Pseudomonas]AOA05964.1 multidrug DMT transporter permease [Pseudomonas sp. TMW 2.1634]ASC85981.1 EamA family transporter [Pseudomonas fragi]MBM1201722.1 DMT family transporter [Pseudomonas fragi]NNB25815.1 DMT family transporter [Pseudomonas fragi]NNB36313.1 DMT family transporter [Pseudomonas fragi]